MSDDLFNDIQVLRAQIDDLIARGTSVDALADTQGEWVTVRRAVNDMCTRMTSADPQTAHAVLDDIGDMIRVLETIQEVYDFSGSIQQQQR